jgi:hypothetical protein
VYAFLADHRHQLFPPEAYGDLTGDGRGHPSVACEVVASVLVLQALEGLSDREAVSALRRDIAWKVACGLRLDDEGFHPTVLVYWRNRIRASQRPRRIFDAVRQVVDATGVLSGRRRRVLDSTVLEDAVATQDTVTQLVAAIRRVRRLLPQAREVEVEAHDYEQAGKPVCVWDDPQAKQALVSGLVNDALAVLAAVDELELGGEQGRGGGAAGAGRRPGCGGRRAAGDLADRPQGRQGSGDLQRRPPGAPYSQDQRAQARRLPSHVAAEPESGLFTACALTAANAADGPAGVLLVADEKPGLDVLGDTAYGGGATRAALTRAGHQQTIKPLPLTAAVPGGFTKHDFTIDSQAGTVGCPAGWKARITASGQASFGRHCARCPLRQRCTTAAGGRTIHVHPHEDELRAARRRATTRGFQDSYRRWRPMVERSIAWLVADGCRRVPYHGIERNHVWLSVRVAALNLRRLLTLGLARQNRAWVLV